MFYLSKRIYYKIDEISDNTIKIFKTKNKIKQKENIRKTI